MGNVRIECVSLVTTDSKAMDFSPEEHLAMLRKQQDKHEKRMALGDVILTNIRFYGSAVLNTVFDFPTMLQYRKRMKL